MIDLPIDLTKATDSLLSHNLRTPLHHLFHAIALLKDIHNQLTLLAAGIPEKKTAKKKLAGQLTPLAVSFKLTLNLIDKLIEGLSMLEKGQDGKPLSIQFKTKLTQFNYIHKQFQVTRQKQFKLSKNFMRLDNNIVKSNLLSIAEELNSDLIKAQDHLEQLCKESGVAIETKTQKSALPFVFDSVKVLVVDDNEINRKVLAKILQQKKYTCTFAFNGAEAVKLFEPGKFDIILMDIQMPVMNGYEATKQIRAKEQSQTNIRVPIIAVTGIDPTEGKKASAEAGMDGFLSKPFAGEAIDLLFVEHLIKEPVSPVSTPQHTPQTVYSSIASLSLDASPTDELKSDTPKRSASAPQLQMAQLADTPVSTSPKSSPYTGQRCNFFNQLDSSEKSASYLPTLGACQ